MSDVFWQGLFAALPVIFSTIVLAWIQIRTKAAVEKVGEVNTKAAIKAETSASDAKTAAVEVGRALEVSDARTSETLDAVVATQREQGKTLNDVHTLSNSARGATLLINKQLAEFKAYTTKLPTDLAAAAAASQEYEDHVHQQAIVDAGLKSGHGGGSSTPPEREHKFKQSTIGEAVGEVRTDMKIVKEGVKDLQERGEKDE